MNRTSQYDISIVFIQQHFANAVCLKKKKNRKM